MKEISRHILINSTQKNNKKSITLTENFYNFETMSKVWCREKQTKTKKYSSLVSLDQPAKPANTPTLFMGVVEDVKTVVHNSHSLRVKVSVPSTPPRKIISTERGDPNWQERRLWKQRVRPLLFFSSLNGFLLLPFQVAFMAEEGYGISLLMIENQWSFESRKGAFKMPGYPPDASNLIYCQC